MQFFMFEQRLSLKSFIEKFAQNQIKLNFLKMINNVPMDNPKSLKKSKVNFTKYCVK